MRNIIKNYLNLEGLWLLSCLLSATIPYILKSYGIEFGVNTGIGRSLLYPEIVVLHCALVLLALIIMASISKTRAILLLIMGAIILIAGGYSFWWPGMLTTSYFATLAGGFLAAKSIRILRRT